MKTYQELEQANADLRRMNNLLKEQLTKGAGGTGAEVRGESRGKARGVIFTTLNPSTFHSPLPS
jgi:hypothetical protein